MGPVWRKVSWRPVRISKFLVGKEHGDKIENDWNPAHIEWSQRWEVWLVTITSAWLPKENSKGFPRGSLIQLSTGLTSVNSR